MSYSTPNRDEHLVDEPVRAAVQVVRQHDVRAGTRDRRDQRMLRRHAGRKRAREPALELAQRRLQRRAGRVGAPRVAELPDVLARRGLHVGRRLVDRRDDRAEGRVGLEARVDAAGGELGHVTSDSSRSARVRMPIGLPSSVTVSAWRSPASSSTASRTRVGRRHGRERLLHHLGDDGLHDRRGVHRPAQQPALADRADHVAVLDHRKLGDAVLVQQRDRLAHGLPRLDDHERRHLAGGVLGVQDVPDRLVLHALEEAIGVHPRVVEDLRQVRAPAVREDHGDQGVLVEVARHLQRGVHREPARAAHEHPLGLREPAGGDEAVAVGDRDVAVGDGGVVGGGPEVLAHALDEVGMDLFVRVDRALRIGADDLDVRVLLLEVARHPGDRAAGADADDQVRELAVGLAPQLRPGRLVVRLRVGRVRVLVGLEGAGDVAREAVGDAVVGARASRAGRRSAPPRPRRHRRAGGRSSPCSSCPASPRSRGSPSGARRSRGRCRCCRRSAR